MTMAHLFLEYSFLIPLIPFAASLAILFGGKEDPHSSLPYLGIGAMAFCLLQSLFIFAGALSDPSFLPYNPTITWFKFASEVGGKSFIMRMPASLLIDGPAAVMLVVVTLVSLLVQVYSLAYMHDDKRFKRYYAYLSFFTASMLGLVVSGNLMITFACWELVGVSSYLLIGFWFEKPSAAYASKKAFMTTKLGDLGFYLALFLIFATVGSFEIKQIEEFVINGRYMSEAVATAIGLGLLCGAVGKSAQWPLFIWLPDAMEGPTPVSALIHAATMVAAGIYLVARCYFIYVAAPWAMLAVACVGLITAFLAASMALVTYDIKRVLAFSTVSQLGFMLCALGCGAYTAGLFHLTTHAFFKALLFLGAGSVIHAVHTNDMREMGGLSKRMIVTCSTMVIATLAISGIWPFAGFYSKEMILHHVFERSPAMFLGLTFSACLTAFYMFRLIFLTFWGSARNLDKHHHAHESPREMTAPLGILAFLSVVSGFLLEKTHALEKLLPFEWPHGFPSPAHGHHAPEWLGLAVTGAVLASIALSWRLYGRDDFALAESLKKTFAPVFTVLDQRYGFDTLFLWLVALGDRLAQLAFWIDSQVIDRILVDGWGLLTQIYAEISNLVDALFIDRAVDGFGGLARDLGWGKWGLRSLVLNGQVQENLMYIAIAASLFATMALTR